jgi:hypothetical protein
MRNQGMLSLWDVKAPNLDSSGKSGWKYDTMLGLEGGHAEEWMRFIGKLFSNFIRLIEEEAYSLNWSKNHLIGAFTAKLGYKYQVEDDFHG